MYSDRDLAALRVASAPTLARIRRDRERAPNCLKKLFTVVARDLLRPKLDAKRAWLEAGIRDHTRTAAFKDFTGSSLKPYIAQARIDVAEVLLQTTDLEISTISLMVGYGYHPTFTDNYMRMKSILPSKVVRVPTARPLIDVATSLRAGLGDLDADEAVDYIKRCLRIYPHAGKLVPVDGGASAAPRYVVDGARHERLSAEGFWQEIRTLPFEEQTQRVREYLFHSTALFDLLRKKSRQHGRKKRRRGIELAQLALVSLEGSDEVFGGRIHDLRALGWAWLGNTHLLAQEFAAADSSFDEAEVEWSLPRQSQDPVILGELYRFRGKLSMLKSSYAEALRSIEQARRLFQQVGETSGQVKALIQRAAIHGYSGRQEASVADLRAACLHLEAGDHYLAFTVYTNLANSLVRLGRLGLAGEALTEAKRHCTELDHPLGFQEIRWVEGYIKQGAGDFDAARNLYSIARTGFIHADNKTSVGLICLDLATLSTKQADWKDATRFASEALSIFHCLRIGQETLAAVAVLAQAVDAGEISSQKLRTLRERVEADPLMSLT